MGTPEAKHTVTSLWNTYIEQGKRWARPEEPILHKVSDAASPIGLLSPGPDWVL